MKRSASDLEIHDINLRNTYSYNTSMGWRDLQKYSGSKVCVSLNHGNSNLLGDQLAAFIIDCGKCKPTDCTTLSDSSQDIRAALPSERIQAIIIRCPKFEHYNLLPYVIFEDVNMLEVAPGIIVDSLILSGDPGEYAKCEIFLKFLFSMLLSFPTLRVFFTILKDEATPFLRKCTLGSLRSQLNNWSVSEINNDLDSKLMEEYYYSNTHQSYERNDILFNPPFEPVLKHGTLSLSFPVVNPSCKRILKKHMVCNNYVYNQTLTILADIGTHKVLFIGNAPFSIQKTVLSVLYERDVSPITDVIVISQIAECKYFHEHISPSIVVLQSLFKNSYSDGGTWDFYRKLISVHEGEKHKVAIHNSSSKPSEDKEEVEEKKMIFTLHSPICFTFDENKCLIYQ